MMMMMMMMIPLFIKTHEDLLSYGASQHDKGLPYTINFNVGTDYNVQWLYYYPNVQGKVESHILEKFTKYPW